jgi:ribosomal protein S14
MKSLLIKDIKRRILFNQYEKKKIILKAISSNISLKYEIREGAYKKIILHPRNSSITRLRTRCFLTNRARSIYKKFRLSRLAFQRLALRGLIPGVAKVTW